MASLRKMSNKQLLKLAGDAQATLTTYNGVQALMESGGVYSSMASNAALDIIRTCQREMQRLLKVHDDCVAELARRGAFDANV